MHLDSPLESDCLVIRYGMRLVRVRLMRVNRLAAAVELTDLSIRILKPAVVAYHLVAILFGLLVWLTVAITVATDATRRGRQGGVWGLTTFLLGPLGLTLYVLAILGSLASAVGNERD